MIHVRGGGDKMKNKSIQSNKIMSCKFCCCPLPLTPKIFLKFEKDPVRC
jgi:hypothetical protein